MGKATAEQQREWMNEIGVGVNVIFMQISNLFLDGILYSAHNFYCLSPERMSERLCYGYNSVIAMEVSKTME